MLTSTGPSLQSPNITTEACQTQQSAGQANSPVHSASDCPAEIFQHRPTQNLKEASAEQFHLRERLVFPPAGNKQFWSSTDSALDAVRQQECPGFDQLPPLEALSQLENSILLFFNDDRTETPTTDTKSNTKKDRNPQSVRNLPKRLRALQKEWRRRASEPPSETAELRAERSFTQYIRSSNVSPANKFASTKTDEN